MQKVKEFLIAFASFIVLDFIWLGFVMKDFNLRQLADIGRIENGVFQIGMAPAAVTYILMALGVVYYVMPRMPRKSSSLRMFLAGAPMGLIIYGVYDTTNLAVLKGYPSAFVLPDIVWGTVVFGLVTWITARLT